MKLKAREFISKIDFPHLKPAETVNLFHRIKRNHTAENPPNAVCYAVAATDTGYQRQHNEDSLRFVKPSDPATLRKKGCLAIVADGMGGHASGEIASELAVEVISDTYYSSGKKPLRALQAAAKKANEAIWDRANQSSKMSGMGTTCTAVAIVNSLLYILHIGDSRIYHYKDGQLSQLSEDHTYIQSLLKSGEISALEARNHPDGNILTKSLGTTQKRSVDIFQASEAFNIGDKLLLSSDGLHDYFTDEELGRHLQNPELNQISKELSKAVYRGGAHDNFSILLVELRLKKEMAGIPTKTIEAEV